MLYIYKILFAYGKHCAAKALKICGAALFRLRSAVYAAWAADCECWLHVFGSLSWATCRRMVDGYFCCGSPYLPVPTSHYLILYSFLVIIGVCVVAVCCAIENGRIEEHSTALTHFAICRAICLKCSRYSSYLVCGALVVRQTVLHFTCLNAITFKAVFATAHCSWSAMHFVRWLFDKNGIYGTLDVSTLCPLILSRSLLFRHFFSLVILSLAVSLSLLFFRMRYEFYLFVLLLRSTCIVQWIWFTTVLFRVRLLFALECFSSSTRLP